MNYLLKLTLSLLLVQLVIAIETEGIAIEVTASKIEGAATETEGVAIETEGIIDVLQEAHELEHLDRRAKVIANRMSKKKQLTPPANVVPSKIDERYKCIPYNEYIVSEFKLTKT